jgi:hypothetical protein
LIETASTTDVLLNLSGSLSDRNLTARIPARVYVDLDPAFNQLWHVAENIDMQFDHHTHFVTIGLAMGDTLCTVPTCGVAWIPTLQPVVLERWPVAHAITYDAFTTVANWRGYGNITHGGIMYGQKVHALRPLMDLPTRTSERFLLALAIHPAEVKDLEALTANKWELIDPAVVADSPASYRRFIAGSKAEFGLTKAGYVTSQSGWFSDRSACYLASGRPVLAHETGFSRYLPTGQGLLSFSQADEALQGIDAIRRDYPFHARAARHLTEEYFDSDKVLTALLRKLESSAHA